MSPPVRAFCTESPEPGPTSGSARGRSDGERHALRQRQLARVVDRVGGAAHVALPRVGAGLASATGLLLPAEGAADLRAGGADVDVDDAAVRAVGGKEPLRL